MIADQFQVVHARAAGLDVHKMEITATVLLCSPHGGEAQASTRVFGTMPKGLSELVDWLGSQRVTAAVLEGTGVYWLAPHDALSDAGIEPRLVHAQHVKQLKGRKTDVSDSRWLARVCQFGLCRGSFVPPREIRELRELMRHLYKLTRLRSQIRNRVHKVLDCSGIRMDKRVLSDLFGMNGQRILHGLAAGMPPAKIIKSLSAHVAGKADLIGEALEAPLSSASQEILADLMNAHQETEDRLRRIKCSTRERAEPHRQMVDLLTTIPGIREHAAIGILSEIGTDIGVFGSAARLAAWAGVCPGNCESAGKRKPARVRNGNRALRNILIECAHGAARTKNSQFHGHHRGLASRRGYKKAILATANKMVHVIYAVLRDQREYRDPEVNYEEMMVHKNAARWFRQMLHYQHLYYNDEGTLTTDLKTH